MATVTIDDNLALLKETKAKIREAILAKNGIVTETDDFIAYAGKIMQLPTFNPRELAILDDPIKNIGICEAKIEENKPIIEKLSPIVESSVKEKAIQNIKVLEEALENTTALIGTLSSNENFIKHGFEGTDWCKLYEDKPAEITVPSGNFINFQNNVMTSYSTDTYLLYNETNEFGINGCLINYEDNGSEKALNAYLVEEDYETEAPKYESTGDITLINGISQGTGLIRYKNTNISYTNNLEFIVKFTTGNEIYNEKDIVYFKESADTTANLIRLIVYNNRIRSSVVVNDSWGYNSNGSTTIATNTTYWYKGIYNGTQWNFYISTDGDNYTLDKTYSTSGNPPFEQIIVGGCTGASDSILFDGTFDLNEWQIKRDGEIIWSPFYTETLTRQKVLLVDGELTGDIIMNTPYDRTYLIKEVTVPEHDTYTPAIVDVNIKQEDRSGFNGTVYIESSNRLAYNFTNYNYVAPATEFTIGDTGFEIMTKIKFTDISSRQKFTGSSTGNDSRVPGLQINRGGIGYQIPNTSGRWQVDNYNSSYKPSSGSFEVNQWYWIKFTCSDTYVYTISASKDGENFDTFVTYNGSQCYPFTQNDFCFGNDLYGSGSLPSNSFIDLTECYIKINDEYVWNGATDNYRLGNGAAVIEDNETKISYTNWSSSNNISVPKIDYTKPFELSLSFQVKTLNNQVIFDNSVSSGTLTGLYIGIYTNKLYLSMGSGKSEFDIHNTGIMDISVDKWYTVKLIWDTTKYVFQNLADNREWETIKVIENSTPISSQSDTTLIGYSSRLPSWSFGGYINYSDTYYKQGDNVWGVYVNRIIKKLQFTKN